VIGAGFAGLATACLLARSGHQVTVLEKFQSPQSLGAGILIQPSGIAAMQVLGIADDVLASGARIDHLYGVTPSRRPVIDMHYRHWQEGSFGLGLHRGVLFDALWRLAQSSGVVVRTGCEVRELKALEAAHDLVVVADGAHSTLREHTGLACRSRLYPWGAVWAVLDDPARRYGSTLWQWYRRAGQMLGIMPTGLAPQHQTPVVSLFWSLHAERFAAWRNAGLDAFKRDILALHPDCGDLLDQIPSLDQLTWARYHDVVMPVYHTDRHVVIGDAAHATSPQLGQGTNLALLDAITLSDCLAAQPTVAAALSRYSSMRKRHLHYYGQASRWLTPVFQSDLRLVPWLRDVFMRTASRWPVAGAITRETLVGVRTGWLAAGALDLSHMIKKRP
jgi:2-polyprenyl-6-methoxyphenol hydroxylase-like FAD-dependent oxidoreductase